MAGLFFAITLWAAALQIHGKRIQPISLIVRQGGEKFTDIALGIPGPVGIGKHLPGTGIQIIEYRLDKTRVQQ